MTMTHSAGSGAATDPVSTEGLIYPEAFICRAGNMPLEALDRGATALRTMGTRVRDEVEEMAGTWSGLPASYEGPEQELVYSLLDDPKTASVDMWDRLNSAALEIELYAIALRGIQGELEALEEEAWLFRAEAQAGYVETEQRFHSQNAPSDRVSEHVSWQEHGPATERNRELLGRYAGLMERISSAAAECANGINGLRMGSVKDGFAGVTAEQIMASPEPMPWGSPVVEDRTCTESFNEGSWNFAKNGIVGAASMVGFDFDPETTWKSTISQSWIGVGDFLGSAFIALTPVTYLAYVPGVSQTQAAQFIQDRHHTALVGAGSMVGWDEGAAAAGGDGWHAWKDDPVAAATETALNIGTFFIPVGGGAAGGAKLVTGAAKASRSGRGGKHLRPGAGRPGVEIPGGKTISAESTEAFGHGSKVSQGRTDAVEDVDLTPEHGPGTREGGSDVSSAGEGRSSAPGGESGSASSRQSTGGGRVPDAESKTPEYASHTLSVSGAEKQGIPRWTDADVARARDNADFVDGHPVDPRTGAPLNEAGGRRNWEMRWDPEGEQWVARNRGHGWGEMGRPIDDPDPVLFDERAGERYDSKDPYRPGEPEQHTPPETYVRGSEDPGVKYVARSGDADTAWRQYQEQISGWAPTTDGRVPEYTVPDPFAPARSVDFDGHVLRGEPPQEVFLEAKHGYRILGEAPYTTQAQSMSSSIAKQFTSQMSVLPEGSKLEWHVSDPRGATAIRNIIHQVATEKGFDLSDVSIHTTKIG